MTEFNPPSQLPLHEQLADLLRRRIASGEYGPQDQLPRAHDLAEQTGVHQNTVLKAYRLLAADGVIDLRRSRGATVVSSPDFGRIDALTDQLLDEAARQSLTLGALLAHISAAAARR